MSKLILLGMLLLTGLVACQDAYRVPPQTRVTPAPEPPAPPLPTPATPYAPPPGAFTLLEQVDYRCDGNVEQRAWNTYDATGRLIHQEQRLDCKLRYPCCSLQWIDEEGAELSASDPTCDGTLTQCTRIQKTERLSLQERDEDCDGVIDSRSLQESDARGVLWSRTEGDLGTPSTTCNMLRYGYSSSGERYTTSYDEGCDGVFEHCELLLIDATGREVGIASDELCDGAYERCSLKTLGGPNSILAAPEGAGCQSATRSCFLDEQRADLQGVWHLNASDPGCTGTAQGCSRRLIDPAGRTLYEGYDGNCDGVDDQSCSTRTISRDGDVITTTETQDADCDGLPELCSRSVDNGQGLLSLIEDEGCDDTPDSCTYETRDATGQLLTRRHGCESPSGCSSWRYDSAGHVIEETQSPHCAPHPETCTTWSYDEAGRQTRFTTDDTCDGHPDRCELNTWDPRGPLLSSTSDLRCDGSVEFCLKATPVP